jgi:hypothetical protein
VLRVRHSAAQPIAAPLLRGNYNPSVVLMNRAQMYTINDGRALAFAVQVNASREGWDGGGACRAGVHDYAAAFRGQEHPRSRLAGAYHH